MTTASATSPQAPAKRPRRARRRKAKVMTEQATQQPATRVKPDVELLSNEVLIKDFKNRWLLIQYEAAELFDDLKRLVKWCRLTFTKLVDRIKTVEL